MNTREIEDLLLGLFDPLMSPVERANLLRDHPCTTARPLDETIGVDAPDGIEVVFQDGTTAVLVIIDTPTVT